MNLFSANPASKLFNFSIDPSASNIIESVLGHSVETSEGQDPGSVTNVTLLASSSVTEVESALVTQFCLNQLGTRGCRLSRFCWWVLSSSNEPKDTFNHWRLAMAAGPVARLYTATHQVLYLHLVARFRCEVAATARGLARDKCAAVLAEAAQLHAALAAMASAGRLDHCTADLWLEQSGTHRNVNPRTTFRDIYFQSHFVEDSLTIENF